MMPLERLAGEFFAKLEEIDQKVAEAVAAARCQHCQGPLHRGNYQRKPRGALVATAGEAFTLRHSLCCGRRGCRKRALPPSLRFLGRRVYLEATVVLASVFALAMATIQAAVTATGVPARTLRRWGTWWREIFPKLPTWVELRARFAPPPPDEGRLPESLLGRLATEVRRSGSEAPAVEDAMLHMARYLAPATTISVVEGSRFVTAAMAQISGG